MRGQDRFENLNLFVVWTDISYGCRCERIEAAAKLPQQLLAILRWGARQKIVISGRTKVAVLQKLAGVFEECPLVGSFEECQVVFRSDSDKRQIEFVRRPGFLTFTSALDSS
jgi:hypothetical protein